MVSSANISGQERVISSRSCRWQHGCIVIAPCESCCSSLIRCGTSGSLVCGFSSTIVIYCCLLLRGSKIWKPSRIPLRLLWVRRRFAQRICLLMLVTRQ
ncbi:hypothetical protein BJY01DRAFT_124625 [Aspergillus pseudoustus]|uniref:Uncharacterized protein n=1 Tax=Aspergillus pseudoustus TaxID=1810923 RepID=A0ABR4INN4_9EURO